MKEKVYGIMNEILALGRQANIDCIVVNHNIAEGHKTKTMIAEAHVIVVFQKQVRPIN